eukprot:4489134-Amphidinium_carterae.1
MTRTHARSKGTKVNLHACSLRSILKLVGLLCVVSYMCTWLQSSEPSEVANMPAPHGLSCHSETMQTLSRRRDPLLTGTTACSMTSSIHPLLARTVMLLFQVIFPGCGLKSKALHNLARTFNLASHSSISHEEKTGRNWTMLDSRTPSSPVHVGNLKRLAENAEFHIAVEELVNLRSNDFNRQCQGLQMYVSNCEWTTAHVDKGHSQEM